MEPYMKNIPFSTVLSFAEQVDYMAGQVASKTIAQNKAVSLTLFAFDAGEEISTHASDGDAMVIALDGHGEITIAGEKHSLAAGDMIVMPHHKPHAVYAPDRFKMFLVVVFPKIEKE